MIGYVTVCEPELKVKDLKKYRAYYCGLCRTLKEDYGFMGQMTLTYDMTFAVILLSSLYENIAAHEEHRCKVHPVKRQHMLRNEITSYAAAMNVPLSFIEKRRIGNDAKAQALTLIGDVYDRDAIIVDDEVDTGGSIVQAVNLVKDNGARNVYVIFVHPVLSLNAADRLAALPVTEFIATDTIPIPPEKRALFGDRLRILSVAPLLGEVIRRANEGRSVGELFNE